jgi:hypothetical protein
VDRGPLITYSSGIPLLDQRLKIQTRSQTGIVAPTGVGKTGLVLGMGLHMIEAHGVPFLYVSSELDDDEISARAAALKLHVPHADILDQRIPRAQAREALAGVPLYMLDCERMSEARGRHAIDLIKAKVERISERHGKRPVVAVDFLQELAASEDDDPRGVRMGVSAMARRFRSLSQKLEIALITVSSTGRGFYRPPKDDADNPRSYLGAAKESGDIEFALVNMMFLDVATECDASGTYAARIILPKVRRSGPAIVGARFHGPTGRWEGHVGGAVALSGDARREREEARQLEFCKGKVLEAVQKHGPLVWSRKEGDGIRDLAMAGKLGTRARDALVAEHKIEWVAERYFDASKRTRERQVLRVYGSTAHMPDSLEARAGVPPYIAAIVDRC